MAESSMLWTTNNTGDGPTAGYTQTQLFQMMRSFARTANLGGVFPDVLNELAVTGTATPVSVNTGQAICYGIPYFNSASVAVAIATPASLTRVDYIVLRASWAAQTVRITRIAGTEGAGTPALTQTAGTTWDIPLATVSITTGGVITVTDAREWANGIGDNAVDNTKLATMAAATVKGRASGAGTGTATDLTATQLRTIANVSDGADVTSATNIASIVHAATEKTTPVVADEIALLDSAASFGLKRATLTDLLVGIITTATFTPGLEFSGGATGITYASRTARYWKYGSLVLVLGTMVLSSKGSSVGQAILNGFPFTPTTQVGFLNVEWANFSTALTRVFGYMDVGNPLALLYAVDASTLSSLTTQLANTHLANNSTLWFWGLYQTT